MAQAARITALQAAFDIADARYRNGTIGYDERFAAEEPLLNAELAAAGTKADRTAICQKLVDSQRECEKVIEGRFRTGRASEADLLSARADRMEAEDRLAKEKTAADSPPSKSGQPEKPIPRTEPKTEIEQSARAVRIQAIQRAFVIVEAQYVNGRVGEAERLAALAALLQAELETAKTKAERIALCQTLLDTRANTKRSLTPNSGSPRDPHPT